MGYLSFKSKYDKHPKVDIKGTDASVIKGGEAMHAKLKSEHFDVMVIECYPGVDYDALEKTLLSRFDTETVCVDDYAFSEQEKSRIIKYHLTEDRVFGRMSQFTIEDFYPEDHVLRLQRRVRRSRKPVIVYGFGARAFFEGDINLYVDMARWEVKKRFRAQTLTNWKMTDLSLDKLRKEKHGYFVDWRTADRLKQKHLRSMDYYVDGNDATCPKMIPADALFQAIEETVSRPFSMVPYFDEGVWGGQWMKEVCNLDPAKKNYAWSFNGVMEENSMHYGFKGDTIESPAINLVLFKPVQLLGDRVHARFGREFPIRFDFLDTMEGQNLSLQVHPLTEYIKDVFGMSYTQDESYYIMDAKGGGVYIGLKEGIDKDAMISDLRRAEKGDTVFDAKKYVNYYDVAVHDHVSIPAGTIHCSATNAMVLEISATPYIFTFKMWDWERLGLDGKPRPIHLEHALNNVQWERDTAYVERELLNPVETIRDEEGVLEERTGLHRREFLETRRHTHRGKAFHETRGSVNVLALVEGEEAVVESPDDAFEPFVVHYAEVFIVPEAVKAFTVRPYGAGEGHTIKTIKASVRS